MVEKRLIKIGKPLHVCNVCHKPIDNDAMHLRCEKLYLDACIEAMEEE